jgi:hypothetical protein
VPVSTPPTTLPLTATPPTTQPVTVVPPPATETVTPIPVSSETAPEQAPISEAPQAPVSAVAPVTG